MNQGYHRSGSHEVMEITSACDLMAGGEPVEAASFYARGFSGFRKIQQPAGSPIFLNADVKAFE